jgi:DNA-binding transcriptional MerR regulator
MTIGQLARRLGVNPRTIRYYERIGLIPHPERSQGGYRLYGAEDEERVRFIKSAQRVGLNLGEIKETLAFRDRGEPPCNYVAEVIDRRLREVTQRLRDLRTFKRELTELRDRIRAAGPAPQRGDSYCHYIQTTPGAVAHARPPS